MHEIAQNYAQVSLPLSQTIVLQNVNFLLEGTFSLENENQNGRPSETCFQKMWKMRFYITKHFKCCSMGNRDHCGNTSVIFNIFWEQKLYWWHVWLWLCGSMRLRAVASLTDLGGWVGNSSTFLIFPHISINFSNFSSNFTYFLPHFGLAHPGGPWLRHWWDYMGRHMYLWTGSAI